MGQIKAGVELRQNRRGNDKKDLTVGRSLRDSALTLSELPAQLGPPPSHDCGQAEPTPRRLRCTRAAVRDRTADTDLGATKNGRAAGQGAGRGGDRGGWRRVAGGGDGRKCGAKNAWPLSGSNAQPSDLESDALPLRQETSPRAAVVLIQTWQMSLSCQYMMGKTQYLQFASMYALFPPNLAWLIWL